MMEVFLTFVAMIFGGRLSVDYFSILEYPPFFSSLEWNPRNESILRAHENVLFTRANQVVCFSFFLFPFSYLLSRFFRYFVNIP